MFRYQRITIAVLLGSWAALAAALPPSDQAIRQLLTLTEMPVQVKSVTDQVSAMLLKGAVQSLRDQATTPAQRAVVERFQQQTTDILAQEFGWQKIEPLYIQLYRDTLTQEEVDGMIAFYRTPAGQAAIKKVPGAGAKAMEAVQGRMGPVTQKLQAAHQQAVNDLKKPPVP